MLKVSSKKKLEYILYSGVLLAIILGIIKVPYFDFLMIALIALMILLLVQNAELISGLSSDNPKVKTYKRVAIASFIVAIGMVLIVQYISINELVSTKIMDYLIVFIYSFIMMLFGNYAPKIPHNKYLGYRLPWTVRDSEVWYKTHKLLGNLAFIIGIAQCILVFFIDTYTLLQYGTIIWILIPGVYSYIIYRKKVNKDA